LTRKSWALPGTMLDVVELDIEFGGGAVSTALGLSVQAARRRTEPTAANLRKVEILLMNTAPKVAPDAQEAQA
jgi:pantothenate kinase type III